MEDRNSHSFDVMITTHNRLEDLKRTLSHILTLAPAPDHILVTADGCHDDTVEWLQEQHPEILLSVNAASLGSVASRDRMLRASTAEFVLSLDDDSYPLETDSIELLRVWMTERPDVAVAMFPQRSEEFPETLNVTSFPEQGFSATYANSGACYRAAVYRMLPGFCNRFFHMYEEPDYALQCIGAGYCIYHTNVICVRHHYSSVGRNEMRTHQRHARNEAWSTLMRTPLVIIPVMIAYRMLSQLRFAQAHGWSWVVHEPNWWWKSLLGVRECLRNRAPVTFRAYRMWLALMRRPTTDLSVWERYRSFVWR